MPLWGSIILFIYIMGTAISATLCLLAIDAARYEEDKKHHTKILFLSPIWPAYFLVFAVKKFLWAFNIKAPTRKEK